MCDFSSLDYNRIQTRQGTGLKNESKLTNMDLTSRPSFQKTVLLLLVVIILLLFINLKSMSYDCNSNFGCSGNIKETKVQKESKPGDEVLYYNTKILQNSEQVFYNRVPKTGSSGMIDVIRNMSITNRFTIKRSEEYMSFFLGNQGQKKFIQSEFLVIPKPMLYERHLHFIDFETHGEKMPVYINLIRKPIDRLVSWYYFRRYEDGHIRKMNVTKRIRTFDECVLHHHDECVKPQGDKTEEGYFKIIPFFCGQAPECRVDSERAMMRAIYNVKKYYLVVGVTEQINEFVEALEFLLPNHFLGARKTFQQLGPNLQQKHKTTYKLPISEEAKAIMKNMLKFENKFYDFISTRFRRLLHEIRESKLRHLKL